MSIVICAVDKNNKMFLASDKRAIKKNIVNDNFQKIFKLRSNIYYSMTGTAEPGLWFFQRLQGVPYLNVKALLEWIEKDFLTHNFPKLAIILSGKDEENNFFMFAINNNGEICRPLIQRDKITFMVSANNNIDGFSQYFKNFIENGVSIDQAMFGTIDYAYSVDLSISREFDLIIVE